MQDRRRPAVNALALGACFALVASAGCEREGRVTPAVPAFEPAPAFDLQGHRGARGLYPENTQRGFRAALAIGVTTLEMDVGVTADGVVVVHHDEGLSAAIARGPDGQWLTPPTSLLRVLTWRQTQLLDVGRLKPGSRYGSRFPFQQGEDGIRIPRLSEVLSRADAISGRRILYNVETKLTPDQPDWTLAPIPFAEAVVNEIRAAGVERRTMIQSFDWRTLRHIAQEHPDIQTSCLTTEQSGEDTIARMHPGPSLWTAGLDIDDYGGSVPHLVHAASCAVWSPFHGDLSAADLATAHELGLRVIPWTTNEPGEIERALSLGVDGLISDYPDRVRTALEAKGRPLPRAFPLAVEGVPLSTETRPAERNPGH